ARKAGRDPREIILVAVTKYAEPEDILELLRLGHQDFGENRVLQLAQRAVMVREHLARRKAAPSAARAHDEALDALGSTAPEIVRWHMIGHLQRNKARKAVEHARLIHSLDTFRLAEELQTIGLKRERVIEVLLQVNCSGEASKSGVPLPAAMTVAEQIEQMAYLRLRGVMTMAPHIEPGQDDAPVRVAFERARALFEEMRAAGLGEGQCNILSMGMSADFPLAIEMGANIVRIGSAIFGQGQGDTTTAAP
ncbi:MAG: YggS family pyridoxal phosphate-dependent enzyme, partial [Planctomycetota bacterium]